MSDKLVVGSAVEDISPVDSQFLFGYPHVERMSEGTHDPLLSSALYLCDGTTQVMFIANDNGSLSKSITANARKRIEAATGVPAGNIMITCTHTHSAPKTCDYISHESDTVVPKADPKYIELYENGIVTAGRAAFAAAQPGELGLCVAKAQGVGTNRRDPNGPADPDVPVLLIRNSDTHKNIACMMIYSMHPTVLHEDSKFASGDFPAMAREYLQKNVLGEDCPVVYHTGPEGNQSPRHVVKGQTFADAQRLGELLGRAVEKVSPQISFSSDVTLGTKQEFVEFPQKVFPSIKDAEAKLKAVVEKLELQRNDGTHRATVRTTECDWFGAEEVVCLAKAQKQGRVEAAAQSCMPCEIQILSIGDWNFIGWPGEVFIEYSLMVRSKYPNTFIANLANGEFQGYIVTQRAASEGGYEASNAIFKPQSGDIMVAKTLEMLKSSS